jgi:hypothetical protein
MRDNVPLAAIRYALHPMPGQLRDAGYKSSDDKRVLVKRWLVDAELIKG